jgi:4-amino-4-deoxy-L-arabinose transferase-like glycosyltransferase
MPSLSELKSGRWLWLWMLLPLVVGASTRGLWAPDEPRYAEVAREVFVEPGVLVMRLCGEVYPDKPPLLFWLSGVLGWLTDWNEFSMRLVSILATLGTALLIQRIARRQFGAREAVLAPALFLGTAMVTEIGGRLQIDPLLTLLTTLAIERLSRPAIGAQAKRNVRIAGLAMGLGMLAKGPIAVLIPMLVWGAWRVLDRTDRTDRTGRTERTERTGPSGTEGSAPRFWIDPLAVALTLLPVGLWAGLVIASTPELAGPLLFGQHLGRITTDKGGNHHAPFWTHLTTLPPLVFPWTLVLLVGLRQAWRERVQDRGLWRAFLWLAVLFVFFSVIPPKRNLYLLPAYPAIALVLARVWAQWEARVARDPDAKVSWVAKSPAAMVLVLGVLVVAAGLLAPTLAANDPKLAAHLATIPKLAGSLVWRLPLGAVPLIVGAALALRAAKRRELPTSAHALLLGWMGGASLLFGLLFPGFDEVKCARDLAQHLDVLHRETIGDETARVPCFAIKPEGLRFYAPIAAVTGDPPESMDLTNLPSGGPERYAAMLAGWEVELGADFFAVVAEKVWDDLDPAARGRYRVLATDRLGSKALVVLVPA